MLFHQSLLKNSIFDASVHQQHEDILIQGYLVQIGFVLYGTGKLNSRLAKQ